MTPELSSEGRDSGLYLFLLLLFNWNMPCTGGEKNAAMSSDATRFPGKSGQTGQHPGSVRRPSLSL